MNSNKTLRLGGGIIITTILTLGLSISVQNLLAAWLAPTGNPPSSNIARPIHTGTESQIKGGSLVVDGDFNAGWNNSNGYQLSVDSVGKIINVGGNSLSLNQINSNYFYIDSHKGIQLRLDKDDNDANATFQINNGSNNTVFGVDESGIINLGSESGSTIKFIGRQALGPNTGSRFSSGEIKSFLYNTDDYIRGKIIFRVYEGNLGMRDAVIIDQLQRVGIGLADNTEPSAQLDIKSNASFEQYAATIDNPNINAPNQNALYVHTGHTNNNAILIKADAGNNNRFIVRADGAVGIGVNNPSEKLDVNGKTKTTNFQMTNGAGAGKVLTSDANGNASWSDSGGYVSGGLYGYCTQQYSGDWNGDNYTAYPSNCNNVKQPASCNTACSCPNGFTPVAFGVSPNTHPVACYKD